MRKMDKLIIEYDPDKGQAFPDNESIKYVDDVVKTFVESHIVIGTEFLLLLFRKAVVDKKIKVDKIEFLFKGRTVKIDKYGCLKHAGNFLDNIVNHILNDIIHAQMELRMEDEKNKNR